MQLDAIEYSKIPNNVYMQVNYRNLKNPSNKVKAEYLKLNPYEVNEVNADDDVIIDVINNSPINTIMYHMKNPSDKIKDEFINKIKKENQDATYGQLKSYAKKYFKSPYSGSIDIPDWVTEKLKSNKSNLKESKLITFKQFLIK